MNLYCEKKTISHKQKGDKMNINKSIIEIAQQEYKGNIQQFLNEYNIMYGANRK